LLCKVTDHKELSHKILFIIKWMNYVYWWVIILFCFNIKMQNTLLRTFYWGLGILKNVLLSVPIIFLLFYYIKPSIRFCPKTSTVLPHLWGKTVFLSTFKIWIFFEFKLRFFENVSILLKLTIFVIYLHKPISNFSNFVNSTMPRS